METIFCHIAVLSSPVRKTVAARRPACRDGRNFLGHGLDGWSGNGMDYCVGRCNHRRGAKCFLFEGLRAFVWVSWIRDLPTLEKQNSRMSEGDSPPAPPRTSFAGVGWIRRIRQIRVPSVGAGLGSTQGGRKQLYTRTGRMNTRIQPRGVRRGSRQGYS
jgi:hypothetical protein